MPESMLGGLKILDHKRRPISDATVWLNGKELAFDPRSEQYPVPDGMAFPARLKVERFGFGTLEYPAFQFLTDRVYLLREEDAYYWNKGIRVACLPYRGLWLVHMNLPDEDKAIRQLENLGKTFSLEIFSSFPAGSEKTGGTVRSPAFLVDPGPEQDTRALARLRASPSVAFAGPMLTHDPENFDVMGLSPFLHFFFERGISLSRAQDFLSRQGLAAEPNPGFHRDGFLRTPLPPETGMEAVYRIEGIPHHDMVRYIDNEIVTLNT